MKRFFHVILIILNAIAAISLILAYLSCFVSPEKVWWLNFLGLGYTYILVGNLIFMVIWIFSKKKRLMFISLLPILFSWNMISRSFQLFERKLSGDEKKGIKVVTYNVALFNVKSSHGLSVFSYLRDTKADIICMQEFVSSKRWKDVHPDSIAKWLDKPYYHIEQPGKWSSQGISTYSAYPIIKRQLVYADSTLHACMYTDIVIDTDTVRIFNMHLKTTGLRSMYDMLRKNRQGRQLVDFAKDEYAKTDFDEVTSDIAKNIAHRTKQVDHIVRHINESPYPVIICGDFNDSPISYAYQTIRDNRKDAFIEAGKGRGSSYNIRRTLAQRVDFILHSSAFKAYNYECPHIDCSDHYPVMCRLVKRK